MKKILYLVRHGQTIFNERKKIQGWCDSPLTALGVEQGKTTRAYFKALNITFEAAYSSTSERASDTLELITDMPYTRLKGLKEWNFGIFESESINLIPPQPYCNFFVKFGGEGEKVFKKRIIDTCTNIMENSENTVLAVCHGTLLSIFRKHWNHMSSEEYKVFTDFPSITNCTIFKYEYEHSTFKLIDVIDLDKQLNSITKN